MIGIDTLVLTGASASAVGTTVDVVSAANRIIGTPTFDLRFVSPEPDVVLRGGLVATAQPLHRARPRNVVVVPGLGAADAREISDRLSAADIPTASRWLTGAVACGSDVAASCTAVFVLGAAGLLDERSCVTTWWLGAELADIAPSANVVIDELLKRYLEALVYQGVAENMASEQSARMVAMKAATDNAGNLIAELKLVYNKTRQAAITKELSEIVSGAAAV